MHQLRNDDIAVLERSFTYFGRFLANQFGSGPRLNEAGNFVAFSRKKAAMLLNKFVVRCAAAQSRQKQRNEDVEEKPRDFDAFHRANIDATDAFLGVFT